MAHHQSPPYPSYDRVPVSPLITSHPGPSISGVPSLQSLRNPYRNQDAYDLKENIVSPIMSRAPSRAESVASDRHSTVSGLTTTYFTTNPENVNPPAAYVAPFGAKQVVSEHRSTIQPASSDDERTTPNKDDVQFSEPALSLVNTFLDQLLFSFLSTARSTSLLALKPAVIDVLKARLARDAIASAEDELKELLSGGDEEEELDSKQNAAENRRRWDLELVWKRTRLRVMVYMRLGEMEDDDEERYVKEEELFQGTERRFSQNSGLVSWAAAIFLTGVLEYVAEQTLQAAGDAAYARERRQRRSTLTTASSDEQKPVIVEEHDVEKVALSPTLGRLWRTWRKLLRGTPTPAISHHRSALSKLSNESLGRPHSGSMGAEASALRLDDVPEMEYPEHVLASNIPLPLDDQRRDIDEIEIPGLAQDPDAEDTVHGVMMSPGRRNSFTGLPQYKTTGGLATPDSSVHLEQNGFQKPPLMRQRSSSVPTPARTPTLADTMKHTPGAFPEELPTISERGATLDGQVSSDAEQAREAEPAANAAESESQKHRSTDVKDLLDKVVDHAPPDESAEQAQKSESHGLVAGAVAGATAAVAAATAMVVGRDYDPYKPEENATTEGAKDMEPPNSEQAEPVRSAGRQAPADEWDNHKSLIDMKMLLGSGQVSKRSSARPETPPVIARSSSDESRSSYTLGQAGTGPLPQQSPAKRQHMSSENNVAEKVMALGAGVATSSGLRTATSFNSSADESQARDVKKRPAKIHLPGTQPRAVSGINQTDSPSTPRGFLESRSLPSLTTDRPNNRVVSQPATVDQRILPIKQPQKRRSIPGVAFTNAAATPTVERNPHRQSWAASVQHQRDHHDGNARPLSVPAVPTVPNTHRHTLTTSPVQEHPVVQRMASLKRNERKSDPPADADHALTSASIRGPEDFDMFVQNTETVKYTLTPETVREKPMQGYEKPRSPVELSSAPSVSRRRATTSPSADPGDGRTGRSIVSKQATSAGQTPLNKTAAALPDEDDERHSRDRENRRSISKPPPRNLSAHRKSGLMAREPRVMTDSTQDFADFIRSTGPSKSQEVKPVINPASMSTTSLHSLRSAHINGASSRPSSAASQDRARSMTRSDMQTENVPPIPPMPMPNKNRRSSLQPRGANGNGELIDSIRTGPNENGQNRISRTVAPFRSTMDSDQMQLAGDEINNTKRQSLKLNTNVGPVQGPPSSKSQRSSKQTPHRAQSRGGLVNGSTSQTVHPAHSGEPQRLAANAPRSPAAEPSSARRRYRNKDPYAIDMEDDDDDLLTALPKNTRQEESLMDFLNNTEPPKDNAPRPLVNGSGAQGRSTMNRSRVNSVNSLRSAAAEASGRPKTMQNGPGPVRPGSAISGTPAPKPKLEARSPGEVGKDKVGGSGFGSFSKQSSTKDLADFLKNSGPEEDKSAPAPQVGRKSKLSPKDAAKAQKKVEKDSILTKSKRTFLGFRKKTWLDMP
ncbi:hypothetical protein LTR15_005178 [Elasticomyces elasticus]|nr:hypothetical protein LTR15_005178 [Elasticomyces elasticus]